MEEEYQKRLVAVKLSVREIQEGEFVLEEGWKPNYLLTKEGKKVSRVNLVGVVLDKEEKEGMVNLLLDDGSGKIRVRFFGERPEIKEIKEIKIGESILLIGRIRMYQREKYLFPEIVKIINKKWLKVRKLELEKEKNKIKKGRSENNQRVKKEEEEKEKLLKKIKEEEEIGFAYEKIKETIKELDEGEGALIEEVKEKVNLRGAEKLIEKMLEQGEIFQNKIGRVKIL